MYELQEDQVIKRFSLYMTPGLVLGFMGFFLPFFYALLPVHEADVCLCSFYNEKLYDNRAYVALTQNDFLFLQVLNMLSYYAVNLSFLCGLIWMVWMIRHIDDTTQVKRECAYIVGLWLFLSIVQFILFALIQMQRCVATPLWTKQVSMKMSYAFIILRNTITLAITCYY